MFKRARLSPLAALTLILLAFAGSCGGGDGDTVTIPPGSNPDTVPEVQVQVVDHIFRNGALSDLNLDGDPIFSIIASATSSLDIAIPLLNRQEVVGALLNEAASGTSIRIVTEKAFFDNPQYRPFYDQLLDVTKNSGNIQVHTDDDGEPRMMHSRFMVIDQARVVTGSYNWESTASSNTFGDVISILNTGVAAAFSNQFNQMFVEGLFGVNKRDDTQHSFLVGSGSGLLEVHFGPTDRPRDLIKSEISQSNTVFTAVQQYKDFDLAGFQLGYVSNPDNTLGVWINDILGGDQEENAVYGAFTDYVFGGDANGKMIINGPVTLEDGFENVNAMNHKLMIANHGASNGTPAVIFSTGNYSEAAFTLNDEVMLIMRGTGLLRKYWSGVSLLNGLPPERIQSVSDFKEFDAIVAMFPQAAAGGDGNPMRDLADMPTGIIFGKVSNFEPIITIQNTDGTLTELAIGLRFGINADLLFDGGQFPDPATDPFFEAEDEEWWLPLGNNDYFMRSETLNPDSRYLLVVPAGEVQVMTQVLLEDDSVATQFEPSIETFDIGPGAVREIDLKINQAAQTDGQIGSGGGGGGRG